MNAREDAQWVGDTIAQLQAENERLREALHECANLARGWTDRQREAPDFLETVYQVACKATGEPSSPLNEQNARETDG